MTRPRGGPYRRDGVLSRDIPPLFDRVPPGLIGSLAGPLAPLYWDMLARFYQHEFEREPFNLVRAIAIEETESLLAVSSLWLERRSDLLASDEGPTTDTLDAALDEAALRSSSARRLVMRLEKAGWYRFEYRSGIGDVLSFYPYAARILEVLVRIARGEQPLFQGYAHTIAALLRPEAFAVQPGAALSEAVRHTLELMRELKILNRNIASHTQRLLDEAQRASDVLEQGLTQYESAIHGSYHRLKTTHNLFKWRGGVLVRLESIAKDELGLDAAARWSAEQNAGDLEQARGAVRDSLALIRAQFESLPEVADDIDRRNARFSGTALRKLMYLLRQDKRTEGQLQYVVDALTDERDAELDLDVYRCELLNPDFLYTPARKRPRVGRQPLRDDSHIDRGAVHDAVSRALRARFSRKDITDRVLALLEGVASAPLAELGLDGDEDYVTTIYAAAFGLDRGSPYELRLREGSVQKGVYAVPNAELARRRSK